MLSLRKTFEDLVGAVSEGDRLLAQEAVVSFCQEFDEISLWDDLNVELQRLVEVVDCPTDRLASLIAFLIENTAHEPRRVGVLSNYLHAALSRSDSPEKPETLQVVIDALGLLASASLDPLTAEWVRRECLRAMECLETPDSQLLTSLLLVETFAKNAPTFFSPYVDSFLRFIWNAFEYDISENIQAAATGSLMAVLQLVERSPSPTRSKWWHDLFSEATSRVLTVSDGSMDRVHGLAVLNALVAHSGPAFMKIRFDAICEPVLRFLLDQKCHLSTRQAAIRLIPSLSSFYGAQFAATHGEDCIVCLVQICRDRSALHCRSVALNALCRLCLDFPPSMLRVHTGALFDIITTGVRENANRAYAYGCLSAISKTLSGEIDNELAGYLQVLPIAPIDEAVLKCLETIVVQSPLLLALIQRRLFCAIELSIASENDVDVLRGLTALRAFNWSGFDVADFVNARLPPLCQHPNASIRAKSGDTLCSLLQMHFDDDVALELVLKKLITVSIVDSEASVRLAILVSLFAHRKRLEVVYALFLKSSENFSLVFLALHDSQFQVRHAAIRLVGCFFEIAELAQKVQFESSLERWKTQLISNLGPTSDWRSASESAQLLGALVKAAPQLFDGELPRVLPKLKHLASGKNLKVSCMALRAIGRLAEASEKLHLISAEAQLDFRPYFDSIVQLLMKSLQDGRVGSWKKRRISVRTFSSVVRCTNFVVVPFSRYPELVPFFLSLLKSEDRWDTRVEILKLFGMIGAMDPWVQKRNELLHSGDFADIATGCEMNIPTESMSIGASEEPMEAFRALIALLRDGTLRSYHEDAIRAVVHLIRSVREDGVACVHFLKLSLPFFLLENSTFVRKVVLFQQLSILVMIAKSRVRSFLKPIVSCIEKHGKYHLNMRNVRDDGTLRQILNLSEALCQAINEDSPTLLRTIVPLTIRIIQERPTEMELVKASLRVLRTFGNYLENFLHLVIPCVVDLLDAEEPPGAECYLSVLTTLRVVCDSVDVFEYSSRILHPLIRLLKSERLNPELPTNVKMVRATLRVLACLFQHLRGRGSVFLPLLNAALFRFRLVKALGADFCSLNSVLDPSRVDDVAFIPPDRVSVPMPSSVPVSVPMPVTNLSRGLMSINYESLRRSWSAEHRIVEEDWVEWFRGFSVELLKESPSVALRSCAPLATLYAPLARDLFNVSFGSFWRSFHDASRKDSMVEIRDEIVRSIEMALRSPELPTKVLHALLSLAEFLDRHPESPSLPIATTTLCYLARECRCFAKALPYAESLFRDAPDDVERARVLISINTKLGQLEAAENLQLRFSLPPKKNTNVEESRMGHLMLLSQWDQLDELSEISPSVISGDPLCKQASKTSFVKAVLAVSHSEYDSAATAIQQTRRLLDRRMLAVVGEGYARVYKSVVLLQQLTELEEVVEWKMNKCPNPTITERWKQRLSGLSNSSKDWGCMLAIHRHVVPTGALYDDLLRLAELSRAENDMETSYQIFQRLLFKFDDFAAVSDGTGEYALPLLEDLLVTHPRPSVAVGFTIHMWDCALRSPRRVHECTRAISVLSGFLRKHDSLSPNLRARCCCRLAEWMKLLEPDCPRSDMVTRRIFRLLETATELNSAWSEGWHQLGTFHSQMAAGLLRKQGRGVADSEEEGEMTGLSELSLHLREAISAFFRSIRLCVLSSASALVSRSQDILRLLTIWFTHGSRPRVMPAFLEGFATIPVATWLDVVPQIVARINSPFPQIKSSVLRLLFRLADSFPQDLLYPISVASKSHDQSRRDAAMHLLAQLRVSHVDLVDQARMMSDELIRVAILWSEEWFLGLRDARRLYTRDGNIPAMLQKLQQLHATVQPPATPAEDLFCRTYSSTLQEALRWIHQYDQTRDGADLGHAWFVYDAISRRLDASLKQISRLDLRDVSPILERARHLALAVPGTPLAARQRSNLSDAAAMDGTFAAIGRFMSDMPLISRNRHRRVRVSADGLESTEYIFLLKSHEDLRQDERAMQLFGFVNALLRSNPTTRRQFVTIKRYSVVPLSSEVGLLAWVRHSDTFESILCANRLQNGVAPDLELRRLRALAPGGYNHLPLIQKIDVFERIRGQSGGNELRDSLWQSSRSSEVWLEKRTLFTRSVACMSIVGYLVGLGDRHLKNLLLERRTGRCVHIDFGDLFEVAQNRDWYAERVPFRLTRLLINAMEVGAPDGVFRRTCESVLRVLRAGRESVMAMLEAFVHDPLLTWRLIETKFQRRQSQQLRNQQALVSLQPSTACVSVPSETPSPSDGSLPASSSLGLGDDVLGSRSVREQHLRRAFQERAGVRPGSPASLLAPRMQSVIKRISDKLHGRDFQAEGRLGEETVESQADLLMKQATASSNLCTAWIGWGPFW